MASNVKVITPPDVVIIPNLTQAAENYVKPIMGRGCVLSSNRARNCMTDFKSGAAYVLAYLKEQYGFDVKEDGVLTNS